MKDQAAIPYGGHLVLAVRRHRANIATARQLAEFARESGEPLPARSRNAGGDTLALRGIPVQAIGVPGTLPGTQPEQALLAAEDRRERYRSRPRDPSSQRPALTTAHTHAVG